MEAIICDIEDWYVENRPKLNVDCTDMFIIGSRYPQIPHNNDIMRAPFKYVKFHIMKVFYTILCHDIDTRLYDV